MTLHVADLPESLKPIADHFGLEAVETIVAHFGGTELWVPKTWRDGHPLNVLGTDLAKNLCSIFGGESLLIPKAILSAEARHRLVKQLAGEGKTTAEIALCTELTERHVYKLLAAEPVKRGTRRAADPRQMNLLDKLSGAEDDAA